MARFRFFQTYRLLAADKKRSICHIWRKWPYLMVVMFLELFLVVRSSASLKTAEVTKSDSQKMVDRWVLVHGGEEIPHVRTYVNNRVPIYCEQ